MLKEFKDFALKGNVVDLAIAVIIGAAFGKIVDSLVTDLIMPIFGAIGGLDFSNYYIQLTNRAAVNAGTPLADAKKAGAVFAYGNFVTVAVNFLIIAFVLFLAIKAINTFKRKQPVPPPEPAAPPADVQLLTEIRDLLAARR